MNHNLATQPITPIAASAARDVNIGRLLFDLGKLSTEDAERVLLKGIKRDPHDASFNMLLARLQVERGDIP
ncbi:MAG: hypothetical protein K2Q14_05205, partial [Gammaproteobacteria bacterium]|nr:hypothetical protein [Gammaproteobacteria bacterium]